MHEHVNDRGIAFDVCTINLSAAAVNANCIKRSTATGCNPKKYTNHLPNHEE
jgi:hypothetical protein